VNSIAAEGERGAKGKARGSNGHWEIMKKLPRLYRTQMPLTTDQKNAKGKRTSRKHPPGRGRVHQRDRISTKTEMRRPGGNKAVESPRHASGFERRKGPRPAKRWIFKRKKIVKRIQHGGRIQRKDSKREKREEKTLLVKKHASKPAKTIAATAFKLSKVWAEKRGRAWPKSEKERTRGWGR